MSLIKTALTTVRDPDPAKQRFYDALLGMIRTWNGETKNQLDRVLTLRDLAQDTDAASIIEQNMQGTPAISQIITGGPRTPPQQLSNLVVANGPTKNVLSWDGIEQANYAHTEIWRHTADSLANATLLGTTQANVYSDDVGDVGSTYYYWIRAVSQADVPGPFNKTAGTQSTVSAVDTAHIADAAIVEAKIGDAAVSNVKIGNEIKSNNFLSGSAGWQIKKDGAAEFQSAIVRGDVEASSIKAGSANIIDTLMLQDQTVTIPVGAYSSGSVSVGNGSWTTIQSVTLTSTGAPVMIIGSAMLRLGTWSSSNATMGFRILRDATEIFNTGVYEVIPANGDYTAAAWAGLQCATVEDTPGAGSATYYLQAYLYNKSTRTASGRSLVAIEVKK